MKKVFFIKLTLWYHAKILLQFPLSNYWRKPNYFELCTVTAPKQRPCDGVKLPNMNKCVAEYEQMWKSMVEFLSKFQDRGIKIDRVHSIFVDKPLNFFSWSLSNAIVNCRFPAVSSYILLISLYTLLTLCNTWILGGAAHEGRCCDQSIGSTVSDAIVRGWSWWTATRSSSMGLSWTHRDQ